MSKKYYYIEKSFGRVVVFDSDQFVIEKTKWDIDGYLRHFVVRKGNTEVTYYYRSVYSKLTVIDDLKNKKLKDYPLDAYIEESAYRKYLDYELTNEIENELINSSFDFRPYFYKRENNKLIHSISVQTIDFDKIDEYYYTKRITFFPEFEDNGLVRSVHSYNNIKIMKFPELSGEPISDITETSPERKKFYLHNFKQILQYLEGDDIKLDVTLPFLVQDSKLIFLI
jgi:hypothetical protein